MSNDKAMGICLLVFFVLTCANTALGIFIIINKPKELSVFTDEKTGCEYLTNGGTIIPRRNEFGGVICKNTEIEVP